MGFGSPVYSDAQHLIVGSVLPNGFAPTANGSDAYLTLGQQPEQPDRKNPTANMVTFTDPSYVATMVGGTQMFAVNNNPQYLWMGIHGTQQ